MLLCYIALLVCPFSRRDKNQKRNKRSVYAYVGPFHRGTRDSTKGTVAGVYFGPPLLLAYGVR